MRKRTVSILAITFGIFLLALCWYVPPIVNQMNHNLVLYKTQSSYRDDYKLHTTPLPKEVAEDLCLKLQIQSSSDLCRPNVDVYAPELFNEIKIFFNNIPDQKKTYMTVQSLLENYLVSCEEPDPDGYYRCRYDLRGDGVYPVFFLFNSKGFYYEIIANIGGS